jgi:hypothetical protein
LLTVCDTNYCVLYVDVGACSKSSNSVIFKNSLLYKKLKGNMPHIPQPRPLTQGSNTFTLFVIIGNEGLDLNFYCADTEIIFKRNIQVRLITVCQERENISSALQGFLVAMEDLPLSSWRFLGYFWGYCEKLLFAS